MEIEEALQIIEELSVLKFFPSGATARGKLATMLDNWCRGEMKQARWLVDHGIDGMDEYPGPATLQRLIADKFRPSGNLAPYSLDEGFPQVLPPAQCIDCNDIGTVIVNGLYAWCPCKIGQELRVEMPRWLEISNSFRLTDQSRIREELRAADVRRKLDHLDSGYGIEQTS